MLGLFAIVLGLFLYNRLDFVPRTVLVLYPLVLMGLLGAPRLLYRAWKDSRRASIPRSTRVRILILGAGHAGEALVRDLRRFGTYQPVGFLDDAARLARQQGAGRAGAGHVCRMWRKSRARPLPSCW